MTPLIRKRYIKILKTNKFRDSNSCILISLPNCDTSIIISRSQPIIFTPECGNAYSIPSESEPDPNAPIRPSRRVGHGQQPPIRPGPPCKSAGVDNVNIPRCGRDNAYDNRELRPGETSLRGPERLIAGLRRAGDDLIGHGTRVGSEKLGPRGSRWEGISGVTRP